jgi:hypothetical protein
MTDIAERLAEARAAGYMEGIARADRLHAILEACHAAHRPDLALGFVRSNATISEVREQLITHDPTYSSRMQSGNIDDEMEQAIAHRFGGLR